MNLTPKQEAIADKAEAQVWNSVSGRDYNSEEVCAIISDAIARAVEPVQRIADNWNRDRQHLADVLSELRQAQSEERERLLDTCQAYRKELVAQSEDTARLREACRGLLQFIREKYPNDFIEGGKGYCCPHHLAIAAALEVGVGTTWAYNAICVALEKARAQLQAQSEEMEKMRKLGLDPASGGYERFVAQSEDTARLDWLFANRTTYPNREAIDAARKEKI